MPTPTLWFPGGTRTIEVQLNGVWVDISDRVLASAGIYGAIGRQTELSSTDPSTLSMTLNDRDGAMTPDNAASPYYPYWKTGVPLRYSESLGARTFAFPDMWVEIPETLLTFEDPADSTNTDRVLTITCVDLLTRLNRAPRFVSTLGAHIVSHGGSNLVAYWTLGEAGPTFAPIGGGSVLRPLNPSYGGAGTLTPNSSPGVDGDDLLPLGIMSNVNDPLFGAGFALIANPVFTLAGTDALTALIWCYPETADSWDHGVNLLSLYRGGHVTPTDGLSIYDSATFPGPDGGLDAGVAFNGGAASGDTGLQSLASVTGRWILAGAQITLSPPATTLWVNNSTLTAAITGAVPASVTFDEVVIGARWHGLIAHAQVYVGPPSAFTHADFLAQREVGLNGFAGQSVDERIRTIANFSGLVNDPLFGADHAGGQLDLEESDSVMPKALFAGRRPGELAQEAAATGGGLLFTREHQLVYQDRKHRFNL